MTSRTLITLLLAFCAAGVTFAQDGTQSSSTEALFERVNGSVCTIVSTDTSNNLLRRGSGFILKDSRLLVTNAHVLVGFEQAEVECGGQSANIKRITNYDGDVDLVLAETEPLDVEGLELSTTAEVRPGTPVYAFGSPYGFDGTITPGLASGHRRIEGKAYIQISTPISPGSSGGPVTDDRGAVIGVTVASLEVAQSINFAIPASAINGLPDVDIELAELRYRGREYEPGEPSVPATPITAPEPVVASGHAEFRGHAFGSQCGDIAILEYEDRLPAYKRKGLTKFRKTYGGELVVDVDLLGAPVTAVYSCSDRYGMIGGHYEIQGHVDTVAKVENEINRKYGVGNLIPISDADARQSGCRFSSSLAGSRFYRPSRRTTWEVDERLRIEMLVCGGRSEMTFVFFNDPTLSGVVEGAQQQASAFGL